MVHTKKSLHEKPLHLTEEYVAHAGHSPQLEKACMQQRRPSAANK